MGGDKRLLRLQNRILEQLFFFSYPILGGRDVRDAKVTLSTLLVKYK